MKSTGPTKYSNHTNEECLRIISIILLYERVDGSNASSSDAFHAPRGAACSVSDTRQQLSPLKAGRQPARRVVADAAF